MGKKNELDAVLSSLNETKELVLHSCCGPCSSYVLEYLSQFFNITVLFYNPCIYPKAEYDKRLLVQQDLINQIAPRLKNTVALAACSYDPDSFYELIASHECDLEGGERCFICYNMRLTQACIYARENGFDFFTTTLSVSPYKNADKLNELGLSLMDKYGVNYLAANFKKKNGYKRSIELSNEFNLYRQSYCGCRFSSRNDLTNVIL